MKSLKIFSIVSIFALLIIAMQGCNVSTANLSSLKTFKDKEGTSELSTFKSGETIYGKGVVSNNPGKVKVKLSLVADDVKGMTKGDTLKGSEVSVDLDGDGTAAYSLPVSEALPSGKYTLKADMVNEAAEKKDSKTTNITVDSGEAE